MEFTHKPVLLAECLDGLNIRPGGVYLDGTLGRAGHSLEIARRLTTGRLIAIDRDKAALDAAPARFGNYLDRVTLVRGSFGNLPSILSSLGVGGVDGMLFDLGVSSPQLDDGSRGFSYLQDAPLDMRMDQSAPLTAREAVTEKGRTRRYYAGTEKGLRALEEKEKEWRTFSKAVTAILAGA